MARRRRFKNGVGQLQAAKSVFPTDQRFLVKTDDVTEVPELPTIGVSTSNNVLVLCERLRPARFSVPVMSPEAKVRKLQ